MIEHVLRMIKEINIVHEKYSKDYFETGAIEKINLKRTIDKVPQAHILKYRLILHESINDYLMAADISGIDYFYRVKTSESIVDKIERVAARTDKYPVNKWMNDIFGCRMILNDEQMLAVELALDDWEEEYGLKNWYKRDAQDYKGIHIYFKNQSNFYFPWELQLWNEKDVSKNVASHRLYKRAFVELY